jgi:hypothetical protein
MPPFRRRVRANAISETVTFDPRLRASQNAGRF